MRGTVENTRNRFARRGELVVMAGAGVSAGLPSAVPSWYPLNAAIFAALQRRLESGIGRAGWLDEIGHAVGDARTEGRFPPDYQAQVIEEMCGPRYFRALQALDIDIGNAAHEAIAALAAAGALRAVVTTNFDRLIERALARRGVPFIAAFDEAGYVEARDVRAGVLPVIKVHGCVSSALSMVDTWKQRRRGRSDRLIACLEPLHEAFWLYAGFSAADLEDDDSYLGLVRGAARSPGAVYIAFPGNPELGSGAKSLMAAYADRGDVVVADVAEHLAALGRTVGSPQATVIPGNGPAGRARIEAGLEQWATALTASAAGLSVAAILEAVGAGEPAVRVLDRLVRHELVDERGTPDFQALQLQYGRLGSALGRFVAVPDVHGAASNASVESLQSLLRVADGESGFLARAWLGPTYLWLGHGAEATTLAASIIGGFAPGRWDGPQPRSDEDMVDGWTSAAQVLVLNADTGTLQALVSTVPPALDRARTSGDVVREARVAALHLFMLAETREDLPALARSYEAVFHPARRVLDSVSFGFRALALGRWHVGVGGISLAARHPSDPAVAQRALAFLGEATTHFATLGMDPWLIYVEVQRIKALADLERFDVVNERLDRLVPHLDRFPVLYSFAWEAVAQVQAMVGDDDATATFGKAVDAALEAGLHLRHQRLSALAEYWPAPGPG